MLQHIIKSRREEVIEYSRHFDWEGHTGFGFSFPCSPDGSVDESSLAPEGLANYRACLDGTHKVVDRGVVEYKRTIRHPAQGICACGTLVTLDGDLRGEGIDCPNPYCSRIYNAVGQELAPRSQWQEE